MARYLVTGGAGFIGSHLVRALVVDGHQVRIFDNLTTGNLQQLPRADGVEFSFGDVRSLPALLTAMNGVDVVLHQAALISVASSFSDPLAYQENNVLGTANVLEAARLAGIKRVVVASSAAVYGNLPGLPKAEDSPTHPASPYALSKLTNEHYCQLYAEAFGLETACLRYFNVFGPLQLPSSPYSGVISIACHKLLRGETFVIYGDGEQTRDFVFVEDVARAAILASQRPGLGGDVFNVASGESVTINRLIGAIADELGVAPRLEHAQPRPGDVLHSRADVSRAKAVLGFEPRCSLESGLRTTLDWLKEKVAPGGW